MKLTLKQESLFEFVKVQHGEQKRKYTNEPYTNHLLSVAKTVSKYCKNNLGVEIALCHDLFEDTECTFHDLYRKLNEIGYKSSNSFKICEGVQELTDCFTHEMFPTLNRTVRKDLEAKRLWKISELSQTVKYADLIDNTSSIVEHDSSFAKIYLVEKERILGGMNKGNRKLYKICKELLSTKKELLCL